MRISGLTNSHKGQDIYVIGTGASLRFVDPSFFAGKVTIGLNQAYRFFPPTLCLSVHPELVVEYEKAKAKPKTRWCVKQKAPLEMLSLDDPRYYVFHTRPDWALFTKPESDTLFCGRGVHQTAMDLAARMGAKAIVLVGVDMAAVGGDHHGHEQHVRFLGLPSEAVYLEYRVWAAKARKILWESRRIPVLSMTPLLGATAAEEDYARLCEERKAPKLSPPKDTSAYTRSSTDHPEE